MEHSEKNLESFKKDYAVLAKKHEFSDFEEMNKEFLIEGLAKTETELLIKLVRRALMDKISHFSKIIEYILNPSAGGGSLFIFSVIKVLKEKDKKELAEIYEKLSKLELESVAREVVFSEKEEAEFIKKAYSCWKEVREPLLSVLKNIDSNWDVELGKNEKSYFR